MSRKSPYGSLYQRLVANTAEPINERSCWVWVGKQSSNGYPRFNLYVPGLLTETTLMAHIALYVWLEAQPASIDEFYLFYIEFAASGMELDHLCVQRDCISPDHLEPVTVSENNLRKHERIRSGRA